MTDWQEVLAIGIVALVVGRLSWNAIFGLFAEPLARWLLNRKRVGLAFWVRKRVKRGSACHCSDGASCSNASNSTDLPRSTRNG